MKAIPFFFLLLTVNSIFLFAGPIEDRVRFATDIVRSRMESTQPIPPAVIKDTRCVASLRVVKAGFTWGGLGSTGLVSCRTSDGWSTPSFFSIDGVNFGLQFGIQYLESVLSFVTNYGRELLKKDAGFKFGVGISLAAGPVGNEVRPDADILAYNKVFGLYAGATVDGFILTHSQTYNGEVYGAGTPAARILEASGKNGPAVVQPFVAVVEKYLP